MFEFGKKIKKVLVVAAHPDDEILGCGGTVRALVSSGATVHSMILAEGVTSRDIHRDSEGRADELSNLKKTAFKANTILGVEKVDFHDFPDNRLDSVDLIDIIKMIEKKIASFQPELILTHHVSDLNMDHRLIQQAVLTAARPQPNFVVQGILYFETASSTEWQASSAFGQFRPQLFVDITSSLSQKLEALKLYDSEMRQWPHARSIKALEHSARWRGASVGVEAAEAFEVGRWLIK